MLHLKARSELADATAAQMRSCAIAATQTLTASACQSLSLWSDLMRASSPRRMGGWWGPEPAAGPLQMVSWLSPTHWMPMAQVNPWSAPLNPWSVVWPWMPGHLTGTAWVPLARTWAGPSLTAWMPLAGWAAWSRGPFPVWSGRLGEVPGLPPQAAVGAAAAGNDLPSYRSSGGHAVAQVVVPAADAELGGLVASTVFSPMQTMLGVWRAALGA